MGESNPQPSLLETKTIPIALDTAHSVSGSAAPVPGCLVIHVVAGAVLSAPARTDSRLDRVLGLVARQGETL